MSWQGGNSLKIYRGGLTSGDAYTVFPGVQQIILRLNQNLLDGHSAGDEGWSQHAAGIATREFLIELQGIFSGSGEENNVLEDSFSGIIRYYRMAFEGISRSYKGLFGVDFYERSTGRDEAVQFRLRLRSAGLVAAED